jgi:ATP-dependent RNA circularization protein (DNA/RNA ligase family)
MNKKPLGQKAYGSIPHLPNSRLGLGEHHVEKGQEIIATKKARDYKDLIIVQEKLDGSNCCVAKLNGQILPLVRSGYLADTSPYEQHHLFARWVKANEKRFDILLNENERICGEWLAQAHGTIYKLNHEPFVVFDLFVNNERLTYHNFLLRVLPLGFVVPNLVHIGQPISVDKALKKVEVSGHGAVDEVEGVIYRVEREGKVDFIAKYVKHSKVDGKYLPEYNNGKIIWNWYEKI